MDNFIQEENVLIEESILREFAHKNRIYDSLKQFVLFGSKRIRSKLALLYLKANQKDISDSVTEILAAGELIHNASLLQDDIIDSSSYRRGKISFYKEFSPKVAVISSDYLISLATEKLLSVNNNKILEIFFNCVKNMADAEINQYLLKGNIPKEAEYIEICLNKTGKLFGAILEASAILMSIDSKKAKQFGEFFGIIFQIRNDLEPNSAKEDSLNNIHTAFDVFGVEKTIDLIDNYKGKLKAIINEYPESMYKKGLEDLVEELCLIKKN